MATILIVDDDDGIRDFASLVLSSAGYDVRQAANGFECLDVLAAETPDIVVTDIVMPDMEGIQTIREIRARRPAVKIVAMSGHGGLRRFDVLDMARKLGANDVLPKPFSAEALLASIAKLLART